MTSGLKVLTLVKWTRRDRFIVAAAMSFGMGNLLVDDWFQYVFTYSGPNTALRGFMNVRTSDLLLAHADRMVGTGYCRLNSFLDLRYHRCVSSFSASKRHLSDPFDSVLNLLLPADPESQITVHSDNVTPHPATHHSPDLEKKGDADEEIMPSR